MGQESTAAAQNEAIMTAAIGEQLRKLHSAPLKETRMAGNDGQYHALQVDVNNLKTNFAELKHDMNAMSNNLSGEIKGVRDAVFERFDKFFELQSATKPTLTNTLTGAGVVGSIMLVIIGGFASLAKTNLDTNITFTNEKIATSSATVEKNFASTTAAIISVVESVKELRNTTIPRDELDYRLNAQRDRLHTLEATKVDTNVQTELVKRYDSEIAAINADLVRLKDGQVGRAEHEQHWKQQDTRLDLLSNRENELERRSQGSSAIDQIQKLQEQVQNLTNRFLVTPVGPMPSLDEGKH